MANLNSYFLANWGAVIGIYQLETVICVGMGEYLVSLLVWIDVTKLTNEP